MMLPALFAVADPVRTWWMALCAVAAFNVCAWCVTALMVAPVGPRAARWQLLLSAGYVFGCAFRSVFPRIDVSRVALVNSGLSTVLIGRSVATVAELCFCVQLALFLGVLAGPRRGYRIAAAVLVLLIAVAECCSWYAVVTTSYIGNAAEESLWTVAAILLFACLASLMRGMASRARRRVAAGLVPLAGYIAYMCLVDVPMYVARWQGQLSSGHHPFDFAEGMRDLATRSVITSDWHIWQPETVWMFGYFSAAVWASIALVHVVRRLTSAAA